MLIEPTGELEKKVFEAIKPIEDPELYISLVDLGLIYEIRVEGKKAFIDMTLTSMGCPAGPYLKTSIENEVLRLEEIEEVEVEVVWSPPWDPRTMASEEARMDMGIF
ncbi:MAG: metal-sulfur cluster assembly factor [Leptospiraceae bacterium]|nr:metal-sulfur cluster assembly factor [Leptospiraceae bacterium]MCP5499433.1 metal-sulfur cluster assembly factor [Leptospiraceae bacterium]